MWFPILSALACSPTQPTLQALVNARAEQVAKDAELGSRLALASGAMAAELAAYDIAFWLDMEGQQLDVHPSVEELLALDGPGQVSVDQATGAVRIAWEGVEFTPQAFGRVELDMLRPQTTAVLRMEQEEGQPPGISVEGRYSLQQSEDTSSVSGNLVLRLADREQAVILPSAEETQLVWNTEGGFWPIAGQFAWSENWENADRSLEALEVEQARPKDLVWPVVVRAEDWSNLVELDLSRLGTGSQSIE